MTQENAIDYLKSFGIDDRQIDQIIYAFNGKQKAQICELTDQLNETRKIVNENAMKFQGEQEKHILYEQRGEIRALQFVIREILKNKIIPANDYGHEE